MIEEENSRVGNRDKLLFVRVGEQRIIMEEANDNNKKNYFRPLIILGHLGWMITIDGQIRIKVID